MSRFREDNFKHKVSYSYKKNPKQKQPNQKAVSVEISVTQELPN